MSDDSWLGNGCGWIGDATDNPIRVDGLEEHSSGIHRLNDPIGILASQLLEVPPRNAILQRHQRRVGPEQHRELIDDGSNLMSLQSEQHHILRPEVCDPIGSDQVTCHQRLLRFDEL